MNIAFNEVSIHDLSSDEESIAIKAMEGFVKCFSEAVKSDFCFSRSLNTCVDLNSIMLSATLPIAKWRYLADKEIVRRFQIICEKQRLIDIAYDDLEMTCNGKHSDGLLYAYQNNDLVISIACGEFWKSFIINASLYDLSDDSTKEINLLNLSHEDQLITYKTEIRERFISELKEINSVSDLLKKIDVLFPSLIFHENALKQLRNQVEFQHLSALSQKLYELNEYFANWKEGFFEPSAFKSKISPESPETLKRYRKEHTFVVANESILVSYHLRYTGNIPGRIYFHPDSISRKGLVCSLSTKLPTVKG